MAAKYRVGDKVDIDAIGTEATVTNVIEPAAGTDVYYYDIRVDYTIAETDLAPARAPEIHAEHQAYRDRGKSLPA